MTYFLEQPPERFRRAHELPEGDPLVFAFHKGNLLVTKDGDLPTLEAGRRTGVELVATAPLGVLGDHPCIVGVMGAASTTPEGYEARSIRRLFGAMDFDRMAVAAIASEIAHFLETHRHCGACGTPTKANAKDASLRCEPCGRDVYPSIAPCVIVLVHDDTRILLARQPRFPKGMFGLVAGFLEPGESLESCAQREILEEVGITVTDLRYAGSQPWPFPSQLMIGMTARYVAGDLKVDTTELEEAAWFEIDALPDIPPPFSIARHLIDKFLEDKRR